MRNGISIKVKIVTKNGQEVHQGPQNLNYLTLYEIKSIDTYIETYPLLVCEFQSSLTRIPPTLLGKFHKQHHSIERKTDSP